MSVQSPVAAPSTAQSALFKHEMNPVPSTRVIPSHCRRGGSARHEPFPPPISLQMLAPPAQASALGLPLWTLAQVPSPVQSAFDVHVTPGSPVQRPQGQSSGATSKPQEIAATGKDAVPVVLSSAILRPLPDTFLPRSGKQSRLDPPPPGAGNDSLYASTSHA